MTVEERRRHQLYEGLAAVLGPEATATFGIGGLAVALAQLL